jgi:predicted DsbA family dithiol-disulfide isomerase
MSDEPAASVTIDFFADLTCPWCYVGWAALKHAAIERRDHISIALNWRTFLLAPDLADDGVDRKAYLKARYAPDRLQAAEQALADAAAAADAPLDMESVTRIPNTIDAHRLVHWATEHALAGPVIDALYQAYFVDGRNIGDAAELTAIAEALGMDPIETGAQLASNLDRETVLGFHLSAVNLGLTAVPAAVFNRKQAVMGGQSPEVYGAALDELAD